MSCILQSSLFCLPLLPLLISTLILMLTLILILIPISHSSSLHRNRNLVYPVYRVYPPTVEVYERAIANVPPVLEKRFWRRYVYLWIYYALFEETTVRTCVRACVCVCVAILLLLSFHFLLSRKSFTSHSSSFLSPSFLYSSLYSPFKHIPIQSFFIPYIPRYDHTIPLQHTHLTPSLVPSPISPVLITQSHLHSHTQTKTCTTQPIYFSFIKSYHHIQCYSFSYLISLPKPNRAITN